MATPSSTSDTASSLTAEQKKRIEENKAKALERLRSKRPHDDAAAAGSSSSNEQQRPLPKRARWTKYYDYDLSNMVDSKGGFIVEETKQDKLIQQRKDQATKLSPFIPMSADPAENPKCRDCGSMDIDPIFYQVFKLSVCVACKEKFPERYSLITKTEAKEDYLLTDPELRDPDLLPHWSKPNPRKSTWNNMMLYVREMVEEYAFKKWGSEEGLDAEYERRESQKNDKKDKKFKEKLADLRRRTMTSTWERKRQQGPHKHVFGTPKEDPETGLTTETCQECGLSVESEEL
ncbi:XPA protein C-terminus-domain-containing protein [Zychaea mexicana]|uniref:XPA protein C-terminus-domain-containing protein n=1 Tax=Zychaea mexicana TaxID=64656 RepID=UPI0022FDFDFF|nr:XPA protein C-terminus-domain-containing protein [Zychaea mexicana]KAI9496781.1 XPA protein C-terminus-domain-containing protein [Zychaea mexicana]